MVSIAQQQPPALNLCLPVLAGDDSKTMETALGAAASVPFPPSMLRRSSTMASSRSAKSSKAIPQRHELVSCNHAVAGQ